MWKMVQNDYPLNLLHRYTYWPGDPLGTEARNKLITQVSWCRRSVVWWNSMPDSLRAELNLKRFKKYLHQWTLENTTMFIGDRGGDKNDNN